MTFSISSIVKFFSDQLSIEKDPQIIFEDRPSNRREKCQSVNTVFLFLSYLEHCMGLGPIIRVRLEAEYILLSCYEGMLHCLQFILPLRAIMTFYLY